MQLCALGLKYWKMIGTDRGRGSNMLRACEQLVMDLRTRDVAAIETELSPSRSHDDGEFDRHQE